MDKATQTETFRSFKKDAAADSAYAGIQFIRKPKSLNLKRPCTSMSRDFDIEQFKVQRIPKKVAPENCIVDYLFLKKKSASSELVKFPVYSDKILKKPADMTQIPATVQDHDNDCSTDSEALENGKIWTLQDLKAGIQNELLKEI